VTEFLAAKKQSVGNIHKHFCNVYGTATVVRNTAGHWLKRQLPKQEKQNSMICPAQAILSQLSALRCCNVLMPSFVQGHRSVQRLCEKTEYGDKPSSSLCAILMI
jgi:hypothetical protein